MGDEQRRALARMIAEDDSFKAALGAATSVGEAVTIARRHGIEVTEEDFASDPDLDVSDEELHRAVGGKYMSMDCEHTTRFDFRNQCGQA